VNRWQVARQLAWLLQQANWPGGYQVFAPGSVVISSEPPANALAELRPPFCLIKPVGGASDPANPKIQKLTFNVILGAVVGGARLHGTALDGGVRTQGQLGSHGRGLLELEEVLGDTIDALGDVNGVRLVQRRVGDETPLVENDVVIAMSAVYRLEGVGVRDRFYAPLRDLVLTPRSHSTIEVSWANPDARWDWRRPIVRYAAGNTAPASPTAGIDASPNPVNSSTQRSASNATNVIASTGAGTFSFAVFAAYDETFSNTDERYSDQQPGTTATAVAT
jgi:hypothetical protein